MCLELLFKFVLVCAIHEKLGSHGVGDALQIWEELDLEYCDVYKLNYYSLLEFLVWKGCK